MREVLDHEDAHALDDRMVQRRDERDLRRDHIAYRAVKVVQVAEQDPVGVAVGQKWVFHYRCPEEGALLPEGSGGGLCR